MLNMAEGRVVNSQSEKHDDDPFANFSFVPPKPVGRLRAFTRRSKYRAMAEFRGTRDRLGSETSLATLSGKFVLCLFYCFCNKIKRFVWFMLS